MARVPMVRLVATLLVILMSICVGRGAVQLSDPPVNVTAQPTGASIRLSWEPDHATPLPLRYRLYRGTDSLTVARLDSTPSTMFLDVPAPVTQAFFYRISAVDSAGEESAMSAAVGTRADGIVAVYQFNNSMQDVSGNGAHLTNHGAVTTADRFGQSGGAYSYNGTHGYAERDGGFDIGNELTLAAWIRPLPSSYIYSIIGAIGDSSMNLRLSYLPFANSVGFDGWLRTQDVGIFYSTKKAPSNQWTFVVGTLQGDDWKLYVDGTLNQSLTAQRDTFRGKNFTLSKNPGPYLEDYFPGAIDDVRLYNRALGAGEIDSLYREGRWNRISLPHTGLQWTLASVSLVPPSPLASMTMPGAIAGPFRNPSGAYLVADTVRTGEGYWIMYPASGMASFSGTEVDSVSLRVTVSGADRWVLVGSPSASVPAAHARITGPAEFFSGFYVFDGTSYATAVAFQPGKAYWVLLRPIGGGGEALITIGP